jgi:hypothetical protein
VWSHIWKHLPLRERCHLRGEGSQYQIIKDGKEYMLNAYKGKTKLSLISAHQVRILIRNIKNFFFIFLREGKQEGEGNEVEMKASLEGCDSKKHQQLQKLIEVYK